MTTSQSTGYASPARIRKGIGSLVRAQRRKTTFSMRGLSLALNVDASYVMQIESGRRTPSVPFLYELAAMLGCRVADLLREVRP